MNWSSLKISAEFILSKTQLRPRIAVILGTGLSEVSSLLCENNVDIVDYDSVPNFPLSTAPGHASQLIFAEINGQHVVFLRGRFHLYEGHHIQTCAMPVVVLHHMGVQRLLVTNASGGLNPDFLSGDLMVIEDHINLQGLIGISPLNTNNCINSPFTDMNRAYDPYYVEKALEIAKSLGLSTKKGVYTMVRGPSFETAAEVRMLRILGADVVGMSSVHEVLMARNCGMRVLGLSLVTNMAVDNNQSQQEIHPDQVLHLASLKQEQMAKLIRTMIAVMAEDLQ